MLCEWANDTATLIGALHGHVHASIMSKEVYRLYADSENELNSNFQ